MLNRGCPASGHYNQASRQQKVTDVFKMAYELRAQNILLLQDLRLYLQCQF